MPRRKEDTESMIDIFTDFRDNKKIDRTTLVGVLEESFRSVLAKMFGSDENFDVIVNPDKGDLEIYRNRIVVENNEVNDSNKEISLDDAHEIDSTYEVGEEVSEPINFAKFGRRAILTLRQTLARCSNSNTIHSTTNIKTALAKLLAAKSIRFGKTRCLLLTTKAMKCFFPKANRFRATSSVKERR